MALRTSLALLLALLVSACASPPPAKQTYEPPRPAPPPSSVVTPQESSEAPSTAVAGQPSASRPAALQSGADSVLFTLDGKAVGVSELLAMWWYDSPREVTLYLNGVIDRALAASEGARLGIQVPPEAVEAAVAEFRARVEAKIAETQPGMSVEEYVSGRLGHDPQRYLEFVRGNQATDLTIERLARYWMLTQERAEVRLIFVTTEEQATKVKDALAAGRPFADVATELSEDGSGKAGGRIAPRAKSSADLLSRLAFSTQKDGVVGPVEEDQGILWLRVDDLPAPLEGSWVELAAVVEESLLTHPFEEGEAMQWKQFVTRSHEVDLGPFFRLVGEPPPRR